jgi:hypothetical protein
MQGQKGASLKSTRRIHRKLVAELADCRRRLAAGEVRSEVGRLLLAERVAWAERQLSGASPPVGVRGDVWRQVCDEHRRQGEPNEPG